MKTTITLLFSILIYFNIHAQNESFSWVISPPSAISLNPDMVGYTNIIDNSGNIYTAGYMDNATSTSTEIMGNLFYNKYNSDGEVIFSKNFTGTGAIFDMKTDTQGNILLALGFQNNITLNSTTYTNEVASQTKLLLIKLDSEGEILWSYEPVMQNVETWNIVSEFRCIKTDKDNNIYIGYNNFANSFITKLNSNGDELLTITQENVRRITSLTIDDIGNIYAAGSCADPNAVFAGITVENNLTYNTYAVKYNSQGNYQWVKYIEDITCPEPQIAAYSQNDIYLSSFLFGSIMFDDISTEGGPTFGDFYLAKLNSEGTFQWVREAPGTTGQVILGKRNFLNIDTQGNIYITGKTKWAINWSNGVFTEPVGIASDALILKYSQEGELLTVKTIIGEGDSRIDNIITDNNGNMYLTGLYLGKNYFDDHILDGTTYEVFLAKLNASQLGLTNNNLNKISLYPNPSSDYLYITNLENTTEGIIYNTLGQEVQKITITSNKSISIQLLNSGVYTIKLEGYTPIKFIKN
ncbi:T9SS type A sorting domain-containing protein [Flavobacterium rakeshii]|uniref:T9SS type A sorting domain-containing protein n=1 Tax=Flavobacterium rakeshii TaxID=1038845 RepID=A0A6N8H9C9_9FLAO|nr:T9SS type A sorting domain-containing protein [Flavobacterium rakeshii]MUV02450.1 T9SS type A sorting domain-containing protein [Flavobacterium rakeshii]